MQKWLRVSEKEDWVDPRSHEGELRKKTLDLMKRIIFYTEETNKLKQELKDITHQLDALQKRHK